MENSFRILNQRVELYYSRVSGALWKGIQEIKRIVRQVETSFALCSCRVRSEHFRATNIYTDVWESVCIFVCVWQCSCFSRLHSYIAFVLDFVKFPSFVGRFVWDCGGGSSYRGGVRSWSWHREGGIVKNVGIACGLRRLYFYLALSSRARSSSVWSRGPCWTLQTTRTLPLCFCHYPPVPFLMILVKET